jgi:hypothetical protein
LRCLPQAWSRQVFFVAIANAELVQQQLELTFFSPWAVFHRDRRTGGHKASPPGAAEAPKLKSS